MPKYILSLDPIKFRLFTSNAMTLDQNKEKGLPLFYLTGAPQLGIPYKVFYQPDGFNID